ncbi:methyltransferase family protein [Thalassotalea mangrovi]|uniref:Isoprenylcysteine carboxylmethyltransferase family protein n=1 Tax=Thalassotalea mangrovi TaxID=2572245 RepID=A0A4U1B2C2_9GAMM|nr:isoprenylcysteine carboxylmethyltransferase family protein [Thalassotalea mangrovi]TKB43530.1 isoprenylcysteine carboxylmethyltransferase family protein [Thalassotalea mangrovi]
MKKLELKVPPLLLFLLSIPLMWLVRDQQHELFSISWLSLLALFFAVSGLLIIILAVIEFRRQHTTVDPRDPNQSSTLVCEGIFKVTRNPMYLGFSLLLLAWGMLLSSMLSLLWVPLFMAYLNQWQIKPEERLLRQKFPDQYPAYRQRVRRWL